jgi:hypothetical protein
MQFGKHVLDVHPSQVKVRSQNFWHCATSAGSAESGNGSGTESAGQGGSPLDEVCGARVPVEVDVAPVLGAADPLGDADCSSTAPVPATLPPHAAVTAIGAVAAMPRRNRGMRLFMRRRRSINRASIRGTEIVALLVVATTAVHADPRRFVHALALPERTGEEVSR